MMQRIARAYASGMMKVFTGQTYDEYEEEEYRKFVKSQYADMLRILFVKEGVTFPSIFHMAEAINSGSPLYQSILRRKPLMMDILWAIEQWDISIETGVAASKYLENKYKRLP